MRKNKYYENLVERVVVRSESDRWEEAREEWQVVSEIEDEGLNENCVWQGGSEIFVYD
jgi:hypothetical protein